MTLQEGLALAALRGHGRQRVLASSTSGAIFLFLSMWCPAPNHIHNIFASVFVFKEYDFEGELYLFLEGLGLRLANNETEDRAIKELIPITIAPKPVRYLGIHLTKEVKDLHSDIYRTLTKETEEVFLQCNPYQNTVDIFHLCLTLNNTFSYFCKKRKYKHGSLFGTASVCSG